MPPLDLGLALLPPARTKQDVVGRVRVERWIEIDQVNALGRDAVAEGLEVAAVVERLRSRRVIVATVAGLDGEC